MDFSIDAFRLTTIKALRGRTWAMDNVLDSPGSVEDIRAKDHRTPYVAVFADESDTNTRDEPDSIISAVGVRLVIEVGVASPRRFIAGEPPPTSDDAPPRDPDSTVTQINATDEGLEMQIGFMTRQVGQALMSTSVTNPWADLWRTWTGADGVRKVEVVRGGPPPNTMQPRQRFASRISVIHADIVAAPPLGSALGVGDWPVWDEFLRLCRLDVEYVGLAKLFEMHILGASGPIPDWRMAQKLLGLPEEDVEALGIAPLEGFDSTSQTEEPVAPIAGITPIVQEPYTPPVPEHGGDFVPGEVEPDPIVAEPGIGLVYRPVLPPSEAPTTPAQFQPLHYDITAQSSYTCRHGLPYEPLYILVDQDGHEVDADVEHSPGMLSFVFTAPFTGRLTVF